jgi:putative ABC transport system ATP-binding protein
MINALNLKKIYGDKVKVPALNNVSFTIEEGEFVGLMGRSGSGKSTLLHQLGLLDTPTEGSLSINGVDILKLSDEEKTDYRLANLGYVFQEYGLIAEFSALENVYFPALASKKDGGKERAIKLLEYVGLIKRLHHYPHEMSGGEQQRVAIARALVNNPKIIFADEPTANLDSFGAELVLALFKKLNKELKKTIIMVTHEPGDKHLLDRVLVMKDGSLIEDTVLKDKSYKSHKNVLR